MIGTLHLNLMIFLVRILIIIINIITGESAPHSLNNIFILTGVFLINSFQNILLAIYLNNTKLINQKISLPTLNKQTNNKCVMNGTNQMMVEYDLLRTMQLCL